MKNFIVKILIIFIYVFFLAQISYSQEFLGLPQPSSSQNNAQFSESDIESRQIEAKKNLDELNELLLNSQTEELEKSKEILENILLTIQQESGIAKELKNSTGFIKELKEKIKSENSEQSTKQYTFLEIEKIKDEIVLISEEFEASEKKLKNLKNLSSDAKTKVNNSSNKESPQDKLSNKTLKNQLDLEQSFLRQLEINRENQNREIYQLKIKLATAIINKFSTYEGFSSKNLNKLLSQIDEKINELKKEAETAKKELESIQKSLRDSKLSNENDLQTILEENNKLTLLVAQTKIKLLSEQIQRQEESKKIWNYRYNVTNQLVNKEHLINYKDISIFSIEKLGRIRDLELTDINNYRKSSNQLNEYLLDENKDKKQKTELTKQTKNYEKLTLLLEEDLRSIDNLILLHKKLIYECNLKTSLRNLSEITSTASAYFAFFWNYELFRNSNFPITIGKLILGICLLIFGYFISRFFSKKISNKLLNRFSLNEGAIAALQSLTFYLLLILFTLLSLRVANIPLTAFTVLGGALAIGVGFGSQNLVNNFISGLILLIEQPVRVGDLIEVDTYTGSVKKIGARSTIVRTSNNIDIVIPNSAFLEKNVINWTRNDSNIKLRVPIGVVYGTDTTLITNVLVKAATEHKRINKYPKPFVWFNDFGNDALIFELHFWATVRSASDKFQIESDLRYRIYELCNENKIVIAFPQRDVHLDTTKPLEIKLLGER